MKKTIAVSLLGTKLDFVGKGTHRWSKWRPNISLVCQPDLVIDELYLLHDNHSTRRANNLAVDIETISPETSVHLVQVNFANPWDFEEVYAKLYDFCQNQHFDIDHNDYLFHITTGTHVAQICSYLLTESRHFPGRLIQTAPDSTQEDKSAGRIQIIDLDLSKYDQLATRFDNEHLQGKAFLKGGIATKNEAFNRLISQIEKVAIRSKEPILLTGPTGAGKSQLATRIYQLKKKRAMLSGQLIVVNCATLKGENAMAALFGHTKGAFTGAATARNGFLRAANQGLLFLDEIGELGLEEQAMLLRAIENKSFHPVGSDLEVESNFQLIAGTNRNLKEAVAQGRFREDLLARINLWTYNLPALKDRKEDIEANVDFELIQFSQKQGNHIRFNKEARNTYLSFAHSPQATWQGNFRDLGSSIIRLCTLADSSRISAQDVEVEIMRLLSDWQPDEKRQNLRLLERFFSETQLSQIDQFDQHQLNHVLQECLCHQSMASAGRTLFNVSRTKKAVANDSTRLQKYLAKFGLKWQDIHISHDPE
ncbi:RNA repair transcriptional activator RtcR [Vibrio mangrovi]|uniref:RNA repair transcriptional activator RtcR n=1 Tax=Vibrio mangrovi TaxID=474394 RepID=A0A1Y6IZP6_9VIBR|nr:RNA repair transcriptional activator RtcR [Vibrio mangrovi]MDW6002508.1 RNA repair transcriptional activator RtcR [Vibrio mangrovi]SMS01962.1 Transcriptional regulatory protein QseF [Vibrio mangrovi]